MVTAISEEVAKSVLDGKRWLGEEEAVWAVNITEQVKTRVKGACMVGGWVGLAAARWGWLRRACGLTSASCASLRMCAPPAALNYPRYKIVVHTALGEEKQQGVRIASRFLRDADADNYSSYTYQSDFLWCNVSVFGMYCE